MRTLRSLTYALVALLAVGVFAFVLSQAVNPREIVLVVAGFSAIGGIAHQMCQWGGLMPTVNYTCLGASAIMTYPRLANVSDPSGCTLTRMSFQALTPDVIEAMNMTAYEEDIWGRTLEARAVGVVPNTLHELLLSRIKDVGKDEIHKRTVGKTTEFAPFKYRTRQRNMQMSYFNVASGTATPGAGANGIPASAWNLTVNIGPGEYASAFKYLARYFIPGHFIVVEHKNTVSNVAYTTAHKIISSTDVNANSATITVSAPYTDAQWAALNSGQKLPYQPTFGAVQILANDVNDYESFAANAPTNNREELIVDWFQTSRETRVRNAEYEAALKEILSGNVNTYLAKFRYLDIAERNKQEMAYWQQVWLNAVFYNQRISQFQTVDPTWNDITQLEEVRDPERTECLYARKAHALGIHTQLSENGRRLDLQGGRLDFDLLLEVFQKMRRVRKLDGRPHETLDLMMDRFTKTDIDTLLTRYLNQMYGTNLQRYVQEGKVLDSTGIIAFEYTVYDLPQQQMKLALFSHPFFEDRISAFGNGSGGVQGSVNLKARGRMIMAIDWEDLAIGILGTNSVKREYANEITAQANPLYTRRMKLNAQEYDLRSTDWDVEFGDFDRHLIIENFSDQCPNLTVSFCQPVTS